MSHSINPSDPRPILTQVPRLSDDDTITKAEAVPTPTVLVPVSRSGAAGVTVKKVSK